MSSRLLPLSSRMVKPETFHIPSASSFPNSEPSGLPAVLYHPFDNFEQKAQGDHTESGSGDSVSVSSAPCSSLNPDVIENLISTNGFRPSWRFGMYDYDQFHSNTHELLIPFTGNADLLLGTTTKITVHPGDVLLLPAGMAHKSIRQSQNPPFKMVGAYLASAPDWDMCTKTEPGSEARIKELGKGGIEKDPIFGQAKDTPVGNAWSIQD